MLAFLLAPQWLVLSFQSLETKLPLARGDQSGVPEIPISAQIPLVPGLMLPQRQDRLPHGDAVEAGYVAPFARARSAGRRHPQTDLQLLWDNRLVRAGFRVPAHAPRPAFGSDGVWSRRVHCSVWGKSPPLRVDRDA